MTAVPGAQVPAKPWLLLDRKLLMARSMALWTACWLFRMDVVCVVALNPVLAKSRIAPVISPNTMTKITISRSDAPSSLWTRRFTWPACRLGC